MGENIEEGWIEATGVFDTENFPTDITAKDYRSLWQRFRRPFANVQDGGDVGWTMVFSPEKERLFRRIKRPTWRREFAAVCCFWIFSLVTISVLTGILNTESGAFTSANLAGLMIFVVEALFTLFLLALLRLDVKTNTLNILLGVSIVLTSVGFRLTGGSTAMLFLVILLVYGGLTAMSLVVSVSLVTAMIVAYLSVEISCVSSAGYTEQGSTAIILDALTFLMVNAFGFYYAYFLHYSVRHSYLKTLAFAHNERCKQSSPLLPLTSFLLG